MGLDILDLVFRLERAFGIRISRDEIFQLIDANDPADILVGDLFRLVREKAIRTDAFDEDLDAEVMWSMYRRAICDALGVDEEDVIKDRGIVRDLGAT